MRSFTFASVKGATVPLSLLSAGADRDVIFRTCSDIAIVPDDQYDERLLARITALEEENARLHQLLLAFAPQAPPPG